MINRLVNSEFFKILSILPARRRSQFSLILFVSLTSSLLQAFLVIAVNPLLQVISNTISQDNFGVFSFIIQLSSSRPNHEESLLLICLFFGIAALFSGIFRLLSVWASGEFAARISIDLSKLCFSNLLYDPYIRHLQRNTSFVIGDLRQVDSLVSGVFSPLIQIFASSFTILASFSAACAINWHVTFFVFACLGSLYFFAAWQLKSPLIFIGHKIADLNRTEQKIQQESFGAIRDIILDSSQFIFIDSYIRSVRVSRLLGARIGPLQIAPRYIIEALAYMSVALIGYLLTANSLPLSQSLPTLGALALAYQNIIQSTQQIYSCWSSCKSSSASIHIVWMMSSVPRNSANLPIPYRITPLTSQLHWKSIRFLDVSFSYNHSIVELESQNVLNGLCFTIYQGEKIGIVGKSGSGKSTTVDILMGLLNPSSGGIYVSNQLLGSKMCPLESWRKNISHVSQHIFLLDTSVAENIAFGQSYHDIDWVQLEHAAELAQLTEVIDELPLKWKTCIGEGGTRLSGGQRQRLGIARAFYKRANLIVMDEATSSLDYTTEASVMQSVQMLGDNSTLLIIAHRIQTLKFCDRILVFDRGSLVGNGSYQELQSANPIFRELSLLA
jgi:ATP-binding cassette subfamily B protein